MKAADIDDVTFLRLVETGIRLVGDLGDALAQTNPQLAELPRGQRDKVVRAKAEKLIRRGLIDGCACGCSGNFWLVDQRAKAAL